MPKTVRDVSGLFCKGSIGLLSNATVAHDPPAQSCKRDLGYWLATVARNCIGRPSRRMDIWVI
jgi:hypothetical protein